MGSAFLLLCAISFGALVGLLSERVPAPPAVQSIGTALLASVGASIMGAVAFFIRSTDEAGIGAVSVSLSGVALGFALVITSALALHLALGWLSSAIGPSLITTHRPIVLGVLAAAYGYMSLMPGVALTGA